MTKKKFWVKVSKQQTKNILRLAWQVKVHELPELAL